MKSCFLAEGIIAKAAAATVDVNVIVGYSVAVCTQAGMRGSQMGAEGVGFEPIGLEG